MSEDFAGKVVVVTGGASGIGRGLCIAFANLGCNVVVADLNRDAAQSVVDEISSPTNTVLAMRCDCGVERDIRRLVRESEALVGPIDIFCSNAGIPSNGGIDVTNDEWDLINRVNVMQHVYVARQLVPLWRDREEGGNLVVTASAAGLLTQVGSLPYSVTKAAALSVAEWLAITHAEDGVRVSCLCPQVCCCYCCCCCSALFAFGFAASCRVGAGGGNEWVDVRCGQSRREQWPARVEELGNHQSPLSAVVVHPIQTLSLIHI